MQQLEISYPRHSGTYFHRYFNGLSDPGFSWALKATHEQETDSNLEMRGGSASFKASVRDQNKERAKREVGTHSFAPVLGLDSKR